VGAEKRGGIERKVRKEYNRREEEGREERRGEK